MEKKKESKKFKKSKNNKWEEKKSERAGKRGGGVKGVRMGADLVTSTSEATPNLTLSPYLQGGAVIFLLNK